MSLAEPSRVLPPAEVRWRPIWYQVMYNLAAQQAHLMLGGADRGEWPVLRRAAPTFVGDALTTAADLLAASSATLLELASSAASRRFWERKGREPHAQLRSFLERAMEPGAAVLVAGLLDKRAGLTADEPQLTLQRADIPALMLSLGRVDRLVDPSVLAGALVRYAVGRDSITYRVHYNVACYLSGLLDQGETEIGDRALRELAVALQGAPAGERRSLAEWAPRDPSLGGSAGGASPTSMGSWTCTRIRVSSRDGTLRGSRRLVTTRYY